MDLTTMTPAEIDTWFAPIWAKRSQAQQGLRQHKPTLAKYAKSTRPAEVRMANRAHEAIERCRQVLLDTDSDVDDYQAEWTRRSGWTQAWLVTSSDGHIHRAAYCRTLRATTTIGLIPQLSGLPEDDIVGEAGEAACTVCYPSAPLDVRQRPAKYGPLAERREAAAKREAERAAKAAAAALKAITAPDGSPLLDDMGWEIKTERTAEIAYVKAAAEAATWTDDWARENYPERWAENADREATYAVRLLNALAHKRGESYEQARQRLQPKVDKKIKSERSQNARVAAQLSR